MCKNECTPTTYTTCMYTWYTDVHIHTFIPKVPSRYTYLEGPSGSQKCSNSIEKIQITVPVQIKIKFFINIIARVQFCIFEFTAALICATFTRTCGTCARIL